MQLCFPKRDRSVVLRLKHERKWQYELQKQSSKEIQDWEPSENVKLNSVYQKQLSIEMQDWTPTEVTLEHVHPKQPITKVEDWKPTDNVIFCTDELFTQM